MPEKCFLAIEDSELTANIMRVASQLHFSDHHFLEANGYHQGIELFSEHQQAIDLVFLDIYLPDGNGTGLIGFILDEKPDAKIIIVSGALTGNEEEPILEPTGRFAETKAIIRKPFEIELFIEVTRRVLDGETVRSLKRD